MLWLALLRFVSCTSEPESPTANPTQTLFERLEGDLLFYTIPTSENSLSFEFERLDDYQFKQVFLMQDSDTLASSSFTDSEYVGQIRKRASFDFQFDPETAYHFLVEVVDFAQPNTRFTYRLPDYRHVFASKYNFEVIANLDRTIDFDFSPSRNYLFISNFSSNEFAIHRLDLASRNLETFFSKNELDGNLIRAISDDEFLYRGLPDGSYDPTIHDQGFLRRMNVTTKESTFVGEFSSGYGRVSRVIDNVVVTNKRFPDIRDHKAINVQTGEVVPIGNFSNFVREDQFDRHVIGKFEIDTQEFEAIELVSNEEAGEYLVYYDQNDFAFFMRPETEEPYDDRVPFFSLIVKKDGVKIYETPEELRGYPILFQKFNVKDNKFTYHKTFGSSADYNLEGLYEVDLTTGQEQLVEVIGNPFSLPIFDFEEKGMYGRRGDQFFSITQK